MPRRPATEKSDVSAALILMRQQCGMTQMEFAGELDVALSTIGRWESWDPPRGKALERITRYAQFHKLPIAAVLQYELGKEESRPPHPSWFRLHTKEEAMYIRATLLILRDPMYAKLRPKLRGFMWEAFEDPDFLKDEAELQKLAGKP